MGLSVACQYDLTNKSVSNEVDLGVVGDLRNAITQESIVDSPNVAMRVTDRRGEGMSAAQVKHTELAFILSFMHTTKQSNGCPNHSFPRHRMHLKQNNTVSPFLHRLEIPLPSGLKLLILTAHMIFSFGNWLQWTALTDQKSLFWTEKVAQQTKELWLL